MSRELSTCRAGYLQPWLMYRPRWAKLKLTAFFSSSSTSTGGARYIILSSTPRGPSGPQTRECGLFREVGHGQTDWFRVFQQVQSWPKIRDVLRIVGLFRTRDLVRRLLRCSSCWYLVVRRHSLHVSLWPSTFPGNQTSFLKSWKLAILIVFCYF